MLVLLLFTFGRACDLLAQSYSYLVKDRIRLERELKEALNKLPVATAAELDFGSDGELDSFDDNEITTLEIEAIRKAIAGYEGPVTL